MTLPYDRIAHRIRDMQQLPYVVVTNPHISEVYDLYYTAFDTFRKVPEIKTLEDNDRFCETVSKMLRAHLTVIPKLGMGVLECGGLMDDHELDKFMNTVLRSVRRPHSSLFLTFLLCFPRSPPYPCFTRMSRRRS